MTVNLLEKNHDSTEETIPEMMTESAVSAQPEAPGELILDIEGVQDTREAVEEEAQNVLKAETKVLPKAEEVVGNLHAKLEEAVKESEEPGEQEASGDEALSSVSYQSVAKAVVDAQKEPTGRFSRDAVDDETLLAELYALIGDGTRVKPIQHSEETAPEHPAQPVRPVARLTQDDLQAAPEIYEDVQEDDAGGVPGWLKGSFILLISLLLSAMTFYAVASDLLGKIF